MDVQEALVVDASEVTRGSPAVRGFDFDFPIPNFHVQMRQHLSNASHLVSTRNVERDHRSALGEAIAFVNR
jgi:hypothetical protein